MCLEKHGPLFVIVMTWCYCWSSVPGDHKNTCPTGPKKKKKKNCPTENVKCLHWETRVIPLPKHKYVIQPLFVHLFKPPKILLCACNQNCNYEGDIDLPWWHWGLVEDTFPSTPALYNWGLALKVTQLAPSHSTRQWRGRSTSDFCPAFNPVSFLWSPSMFEIFRVDYPKPCKLR